VGLGVLAALLLALYPREVPPGLSIAEQQSIVTSHAISFSQLPAPQQVVNLPFHALQKLSTDFLGLTPFGVRLPSLIFAALTVLALATIIKRWFKTNVAIVSTVIILTSTWFLSLARLGTPDIMIPFWTATLILCATYVSQQTKRWHLWKALFGLSAALSLYTPYMAYLFAATLIASIAQPHLRYLIRQSSKVGLTIGVFFFIMLMAPLGWGIYKDPGLIRDILAIPAQLPEPLKFGADLLQALSNLANPFNTTVSQTIMPLLSITTLCLVAAGGFRLLGDFHSVRAYVLLIWLALLIPIIGFNPGNLTVLIVPCMLVMAIGLNLIVRYWYRLFPYNPYARIFGLVPLFILIFTVMQFNYQRYVLTMLYSPDVSKVFSDDAFLVQAEADKLPANSPLTIVASAQDQALYQVIASRRPNTALQLGSAVPNRPGAYIVAVDQIGPFAVQKPAAPSHLVVNDRKENGLRFRFYQ
jgi:4-amino-4-deoxy-L-arabinose transferase-like glycosyltransferase